MCNCEFDPDPAEPDEPSWHFLRTCPSCGKTWWGLHCPHDGRQNPCMHCGVTPAPIPDPEAQISDVVRSHMEQVTTRIMNDMRTLSTTTTAAPEPETLTSSKLLAVARNMPPPLPRLVPVPRGWDTACIGGDEVIHVWEENPAYGLIPSGTAMRAKMPTLFGGWEEVAFVREDEMPPSAWAGVPIIVDPTMPDRTAEVRGATSKRFRW